MRFAVKKSAEPLQCRAAKPPPGRNPVANDYTPLGRDAALGRGTHMGATAGLTTVGTFRQTSEIDARPLATVSVAAGLFSCPRGAMARGRKRKAGQREANGRIQRDPFAGRPAQAHLEAIGVNPKDQSIHCIVEARRVAAGASPRDELASTPLGMMRAINLISAEQYQAGLLYEANQERLGKMLQGQRRTRSELASFLASGSSVYAGIDDDNFKKAYYRCRWVEREIAARVADWPDPPSNVRLDSVR
jgi:hypothetical protein